MAENRENLIGISESESGNKKLRILLVKSRLDAHDRGVRYVAKELRDAGMEVILTRYRLPEEILAVAVQEAADVIGVSCSTGGHLYVAETIHRCLQKEGIKDIKVIFGGIIPDLDIPRMKEMGVSAIFGPGSSIKEILQAIT